MQCREIGSANNIKSEMIFAHDFSFLRAKRICKRRLVGGRRKCKFINQLFVLFITDSPRRCDDRCVIIPHQRIEYSC